MHKVRVFILLLLITNLLRAQQLIINEVSQGTGTSEYVEFVVIGSPTCITPVPSLDLRKVIIDDNNGYFAPGSGTGIAPGAIRFANIPFWQTIPQGTFIVIYNATSPNTSLPADDLSMTDGNCRLIIPSSSTLLEKTTLSPTTTNQSYPLNDNDWTSGGSWSPLAMSNSDDSFQVPNIPSTGVPFHSVSWGNNTNNTLVYFAGSAAGIVFSFTNTNSNDWNLVTNWTSANVTTGQTPGMANSVLNDAWIAGMNPLCSVNPGMTLTPFILNESCVNSCDGSIQTSVNNGLAPFTYSWSNGATSSSITNSCPGTYTVTFGNVSGWKTPSPVTFNLNSVNEYGGGNAGAGIYVRSNCSENKTIPQIQAAVQFQECDGTIVNLRNSSRPPAPSLTVNGKNLPLDRFGPTTYESFILGDNAYIYRELTSLIYSTPGSYCSSL